LAQTGPPGWGLSDGLTINPCKKTTSCKSSDKALE